MKRSLVVCAVAVAVIAIFAPALAQTPQADEPATKFEKVILTKGSLGVREFWTLGRVTSGRGGSAEFELARWSTPGAPNSAVMALRVSVKETGRVERERIGVWDREEVVSFAKTIPEMAKMAAALKAAQNDAADNGSTEVGFNAGSLKVVAFVGRRPHQKPGIAIQAGNIGSTQAFFDLSDLDRIKELVDDAVAKMAALDKVGR